MSGSFLFIEAPGFTEVVSDYFGTDDNYAKFQTALAGNPEDGKVVAGAPPLRKARWSNPRLHSGKRGGLRVIYIHVPDVSVILLLDVYEKREVSDLSDKERRLLADLGKQSAEVIRKEYRRNEQK